MQRQTTLNLIALALLATIAVALITLPRSKHAELVKRQSELEESLVKLLETQGETKILVTPLPGLLEDLLSEYSMFAEHVSGLRARIGQIELRRQPLGIGRDLVVAAQDSDGIGLYGELLELFEDHFTAPIELPKELRAIAGSFDPAVTAQGTFNTFMQRAIETGLVLPYQQLEDVPPDTVATLLKEFSLFQTTIKVLDHQMRIYRNELIAEADNARSYFELPFDANIPDDVYRDLQSTGRGFTVNRKFKGLGVQRYYHFPVHDRESFPEYHEHKELYNNVRDHVVRDVFLIIGASRSE